RPVSFETRAAVQRAPQDGDLCAGCGWRRLGYEAHAVRRVWGGGTGAAVRQGSAGGRVCSQRTDSGREQALRAPQVEGEAGEGGGDVGAGGIEVAHARACVATLECA